MSNFINKKSQLINKMLNALSKATISSNDYLSSNDPFFGNDNNVQPFQQHNNLFVNAQIPEGLNRNIKLLYEILGHQKRKFIMDHGLL